MYVSQLLFLNQKYQCFYQNPQIPIALPHPALENVPLECMGLHQVLFSQVYLHIFILSHLFVLNSASRFQNHLASFRQEAGEQVKAPWRAACIYALKWAKASICVNTVVKKLVRLPGVFQCQMFGSMQPQHPGIYNQLLKQSNLYTEDVVRNVFAKSKVTIKQ